MTPFAAPLTVAPGSPAGTAVLFDPGTSDASLGLLMLSTDVPQWITVAFGGVAGIPGSASFGVYVGPGGAALDLHGTPLSAFGAGQVTVTTIASASGLGALLTGCLLP